MIPAAVTGLTVQFTATSIAIQCKAKGQHFDFTLTLSVDNGTLTLLTGGVKLDGIKAPHTAVDKLAVHFAHVPGLSYSDGLWRLALPVRVRAAGVQGGVLAVVLE